MTIAFIDLKAQLQRIRPQMHAALLGAVDAGQYIMGPQVSALEAALSAFTGARHTLACANGTDALALPLLAWGVGPGDAVFCPSFSFVATAEILPWLGAEPVFVDILPDTYNMDPASLEAAIEGVRREGRLKPKAAIAVDLFGQLADYPALSRVVRAHGLKLIADSAQGFGATLDGAHPIRWADAVTTSFYPAKPLGCYGDGGAVQTNDEGLAELIDSLRVHGKATEKDVAAARFGHEAKYLNSRVGMNSRLDTLQACVLLEKLKIFPEEIDARMRVAARYNALLEGVVAATPKLVPGAVSVWAQYTIEATDRDGLAAHLKSKNIPTAVYYPVPIHMQAAYRDAAVGAGGLAVTEEKAARVISLPMHPYLDERAQDAVVEAVRGFNRR